MQQRDHTSETVQRALVYLRVPAEERRGWVGALSQEEARALVAYLEDHFRALLPRIGVAPRS